jgi:hypothetical protein
MFHPLCYNLMLLVLIIIILIYLCHIMTEKHISNNLKITLLYNIVYDIIMYYINMIVLKYYSKNIMKGNIINLLLYMVYHEKIYKYPIILFTI